MLTIFNAKLTLGVFDFMQRHEDRSAADLKQCMPVRKCIRLEPMLRHGHVWHESTAITFREQPADSAGTVSPERLMTTQLFRDWPNLPHDNNDMCF